MTCIVVVKHKKNKCMAASDRRVSISSDEYTVDPYSKVRKIDGLLIGGSGSAGPIEIFMLLKELKNVTKSENVWKYVVMELAPAWKKSLIKAGILMNSTDISDRNLESDVFVAYKGRCYTLALHRNGTICPLEVSLPTAFGCGGSLALAALKGIEYSIDGGSDVSVEYKLTMALSIVAELNSACDDNVDITKE